MAKILFLIVAATTLTLMSLPHSTEAAVHTVGGSAGWIIPVGDASFYSSYAANTTFKLNDTLVFSFKTGAHNVVTLSKKNYEDCKVNEKMESFDEGPARITLNRTVELYFACGFLGHCSLGQKLSIHVSESGSSFSLAPVEAPSPAGSGATLSLSVTLSVLLMPIAINLLF